jgi:hypothetical protein
MEAHLREALGDPLTLVFTLIRVGVVYAVLLLFLRLSGKRVLGQMTPVDLLTLLLSNVVQNAMIGPDNSLLIPKDHLVPKRLRKVRSSRNR